MTMDKYCLLIHKQKPLSAIREVLDGFFPGASQEKLANDTFLFRLPAFEEPPAIEDLRNLIITDFEENLTMAYLPETLLSWIDKDLLVYHLSHLPYDEYDAEGLVLSMIMHDEKTKKTLRKTLTGMLSQSAISTALSLVEADMNHTVAAANLYIHRNTLLYRIDQIEALTGIAVRRFKGLMVFYLLFTL